MTIVTTYYDLSHQIDQDTYHPYGFPRFHNIQMFSSHRCRDAIFSMSLHFATHIDAPWHMIETGKRLDEIGIRDLIGEAVVVDLSADYGPSRPKAREISLADLQQAIEVRKLALKKGDALVVYTGWAPLFKTAPALYYGQYRILSNEACQWLVKRQIRIVALDAPDLDLPERYGALPFTPVNHETILGNDIFVIENVGGEVTELLDQRVLLIPAPMKIGGEYASGAPVRLLATRGKE